MNISTRSLSPEEKRLAEQEPEKFRITMRLAAKAMFEEEARYETAGEDDGNANTFLHTYWAALLTHHISDQWADTWTSAHESEPALHSSQMDLFNNQLGIFFSKQNPALSDEQLAIKTNALIKNGQGRVLNKQKLIPSSSKGERQNTIFDGIYKKVLSLVVELVSSGHALDRNADTMTPLMVACIHNYVESVHVLLEQTNCAPTNSRGQTALFFASSRSNEIVSLLISRGANVNLTDSQGQTPLMEACISGKEDIVQLLLNAGADPNIKNTNGTTAYQFAMNEGHSDIARFLRKRGA